MSLWYTQGGSRYADKGKFRSRPKLGASHSAGDEYRDWFYNFVTHQTGSSVRRTSYAVTISDPQRNRVDYLSGYSSLAQATEAAKEYIDKKLAAIKLNRIGGGQIGTIPAVPDSSVPQEK